MRKPQQYHKCYPAYISHYIVTLSCIMVLFSACSSYLAGASSTQSAPLAITHPAAAKLDANGSETEGSIRAQLAKIQPMIRAMSLDQKLGQLILVEYLGNSYQDNYRTI